MPWLGSEPGLGPAGRCPGQPGVLDDLGELGQRELADAARPQQHREMPVEVRRGEERRVRVLDQRLLVRVRRHPEHHDVRVPLTGIRVDGVRPRVTEEHERPAADLVDRVALRPMLHRDVRHPGCQLVHIPDPCPPLVHDRSPILSRFVRILACPPCRTPRTPNSIGAPGGTATSAPEACSGPPQPRPVRPLRVIAISMT